MNYQVEILRKENKELKSRLDEVISLSNMRASELIGTIMKLRERIKALESKKEVA